MLDKTLIKYEKLVHQFDLPLVFLKKDNGVVEVRINHAETCILPQSYAQSLNIHPDQSVEGSISCEAIFHIKLNKKRNFEVVQDINEFSLTLTKTNWSIDGQELSDPSDDKDFYKLNPGDPLFGAVHSFLNQALEKGELDDLITRNDGEPWSRPEALMALEIYLRSDFDMTQKEQDDLIKEYIKNGLLSRTVASVRMMVHIYRGLDDDNPKDGFSGAGNVFREIWKEYNAGSVQVNIKRDLR